MLGGVDSLPAGGGRPLHSPREVLSRLTEVKARRELVQRSIPLAEVSHWRRTDDEIAHEEGLHFRLIAWEIRAANREVTHWSQPLLAPAEQGLAAFLVRRVAGVHLLAHARSEAGVLDVAELAPTVQCQPGHARSLPPGSRPRYLDLVLDTHPGAGAVRLGAVGGRRPLPLATNRYLLVEAGDDFPLDVPEEFLLGDRGTARRAVQRGNYVNIEARTLVAALRATRTARGEPVR